MRTMRWVAAVVALVAVLAARPTGALEMDYDATPGKMLFVIQSRGGVASALQELTATPDFVLYGDGTAIWCRYDPRHELRALMTVRLTPDEVRRELEWIASRGYADWYDRYDEAAAVRDLPTTTFTLNLKDQVLKRQVYGLQYALKRGSVPVGCGEIFDRYSKFSHAGEKPYAIERVLVFARALSKAEARRGRKVLGWGIKQVKLADFARDGENEYGQVEASGKDAQRVIERLRKWALFSSDLSTIIFFSEKKTDYQVGYRPVLPGE